MGRHLLLLLLATAALTGTQRSRTPTVVELLDRYASGSFDDVVQYLAGEVDFDALLAQLRRDGPSWIDARGAAERGRRRLTAATFALEAARADEWHEWKWIQAQPPMPGGAQYLNILYWKAPPLLIEWGCELMRRDAAPPPIERWWQLAALAVAQRSEDPAFLVGDTNIGRGAAAGEIGNIQDEIKHLDHAQARFPKEARFMLAQGIARDRAWPEDAEQAYTALLNDPDVGGEASMRLGAMRLRQRRLDDALQSLEHGATLTRDPYVVFLARYFAGKALEQQRRSDRAEAAYRGAVAAIPHAQSASIALAALLFRDGRRGAAYELMDGMLAANPAPLDPWRAYVHADDRFWAQLIGRLRAEIRR